MSELPMPSDLRKASAPEGSALPPPPEPPSIKLIVRLFLIPLLIAAAVIGVMIPFGLLTGSQGSLESALADLRRPGGERTATWLVGPGAKQRYIDAKTVVDHLRQSNFSEADKIKLTKDLVDILDHHTQPEEGEVQHVLLLALGQVWLRKPNPAKAGEYLTESSTVEAEAARKLALDTLLTYAGAPQVPTRKAAVLALAYWKGRDEAQAAIPKLIARLREDTDLDVRMSAATSLGQLARSDDVAVIDALGQAMRDSDPRNVELVWNAAIALAQLNQPDAKDVVLRLLDRKELDAVQYYDRETDPQNPRMRSLNDAEKERILINAILGSRRYPSPEVQNAIRTLATSDPSERVKQAALEVTGK